MATYQAAPGPAYKIITPRLVIRCPQPTDAADMDLAIRQSIEHLLPWMEWAQREPVSFQQRIEFLRLMRGNFDLGKDFGYLTFDPSESLVLGGTGLHTHLGSQVREIGYWIHKDHINQGYATEVSAALTKVAFLVDHVTRVEIHCSPKNIRSAAIPRKLGFIHEATMHNRVVDIDGSMRDSMIWSMFDENFASSPASAIVLQAFDAAGRRII
jgi:RimJ/RimL family protein N-acetyltransferase